MATSDKLPTFEQIWSAPHPVQNLSPAELRLRLWVKHGRTEALPSKPRKVAKKGKRK